MHDSLSELLLPFATNLDREEGCNTEAGDVCHGDPTPLDGLSVSEEPPRTLKSIISVIVQMRDSLILLDNKYHLTGFPTESDWEKLHAFTRTVEEFILTDSDPNAPQVPDAVYFFLALRQDPTRPFFPSLSRFCVECTTPMAMAHILLFISPVLKEVVLRGLPEDSGAAFTMFLKRLGKETQLSSLILDPVNLVSQTVGFIAECHSLQNLDLRNVASCWHSSALESAFDSIASLCQLKCLKLDVASVNGSYRSQSESVRASLVTQKWPSVQEFHLKGTLTTAINIIFDRIKMSNLRTLHVELTDHDVKATIRPIGQTKQRARKVVNPLETFFKIISENAAALSCLTLAFCNNGTSCVLSAGLLWLLHTLHNIEKLEISGAKIYGLENIISKLTSQWTKIQTLRLPLSASHGISVLTMMSIAKSCPELSCLQIPITMSSITPPSTQDIISHPLSLLLVASPDGEASNATFSMNDVRAVACALYSSFPHLEQVDGNGQEFWTEVESELVAFRQMRAIDEKRAAKRSAEDGIADVESSEMQT